MVEEVDSWQRMCGASSDAIITYSGVDIKGSVGEEWMRRRMKCSCPLSGFFLVLRLLCYILLSYFEDLK